MSPARSDRVPASGVDEDPGAMTRRVDDTRIEEGVGGCCALCVSVDGLVRRASCVGGDGDQCYSVRLTVPR